MPISIKCFSCNEEIGHQCAMFQTLQRSNDTISEEQALNEVGLERRCCRDMLYDHPGLIEILLSNAEALDSFPLRNDADNKPEERTPPISEPITPAVSTYPVVVTDLTCHPDPAQPPSYAAVARDIATRRKVHQETAEIWTQALQKRKTLLTVPGMDLVEKKSTLEEEEDGASQESASDDSFTSVESEETEERQSGTQKEGRNRKLRDPSAKKHVGRNYSGYGATGWGGQKLVPEAAGVEAPALDNVIKNPHANKSSRPIPSFQHGDSSVGLYESKFNGDKGKSTRRRTREEPDFASFSSQSYSYDDDDDVINEWVSQPSYSGEWIFRPTKEEEYNFLCCLPGEF